MESVCGQLEVSKFWSVLTKKNKLEDFQINTHVGDFPYILFVVFFFLTRITPKMTLLCFLSYCFEEGASTTA